MEIKKFEVKYKEYIKGETIPADVNEIIQNAIEATETAYAPYSLYRVGAAVRMSNGDIIKGSNQENVAYPSGLCAERVALYTASAAYPDMDVKSIAVTVKHDFKNSTEVFSPCGACRQVMAEMESKTGNKIEIIVHSLDGKTQIFDGVSQLLPFSFHNSSLNKKDQ